MFGGPMGGNHHEHGPMGPHEPMMGGFHHRRMHGYYPRPGYGCGCAPGCLFSFLAFGFISSMIFTGLYKILMLIF